MKTKNNQYLKIAGILVLGILLGWLIFGGNNETSQEHDHETVDNVDQIWTCSMHPQIRQNEPGSCPICGMDLTPLATANTDAEPGVYTMSENAMKLANIQTMIVGRGATSKEIRLNGKVSIDERNAYSQSTHIPGRIEQLAINFTGEKVNRGQQLATVYSPELVTAQEELLQASRIRESQPELFEAAKEKLRNWRIGEAQINQIITEGKALQRFSIRADVNGIVTEKMVDLGDYVERGMPLYEISDLSKVWILFDLYESELAWIKEGATITYTINSLPGERFEGKIDFIDPIINAQTRVASARVEVDNRDGKLKPEMFASGIIENTKSIDNDQIVIPKSAVLWTGTRSIIYVKSGNSGFKMREVTLGPALGNSYVITEGLEDGEEIVSNGAFTIDAAAQLSGLPSMMNPEMESDVEETNDLTALNLSEDEKKNFSDILSKYFEIKNALAKDQFSEAKQSAVLLNSILQEPKNKIFESGLLSHSKMIAESTTIENMRMHFIAFSSNIINLVTQANAIEDTYYVQFCPMANNDKGANWLSQSSQIENPYYGSAMLRCGEVTKTLNKK